MKISQWVHVNIYQNVMSIMTREGRKCLDKNTLETKYFNYRTKRLS
jgi:hypothetical protein